MSNGASGRLCPCSTRLNAGLSSHRSQRSVPSEHVSLLIFQNTMSNAIILCTITYIQNICRTIPLCKRFGRRSLAILGSYRQRFTRVRAEQELSSITMYDRLVSGETTAPHRSQADHHHRNRGWKSPTFGIPLSRRFYRPVFGTLPQGLTPGKQYSKSAFRRRSFVIRLTPGFGHLPE